MLAAESTVVAIGVLGFLATVGCSLPAIRALWVRFVQGAEHGAIRLEDAPDAPSSVGGYADDDGEATGDSAAEFERAGWWQSWVIAAFSVAGFGVSLAQALVATCAEHGYGGQKHLAVTSWVQMVGWVSASVRSPSLFPSRERDTGSLPPDPSFYSVRVDFH